MTWTGYSVLRAGIRVVVELKGVLDVIRIVENEISCQTNSTASAVMSTTERFSGMREGEEGHEGID